MNNKTVVLGVTGGIAAYKMANFSHFLVRHGYDVHVVMTENATKFITPLTFEILTGNCCITDTFTRSGTFEVEHIALAKKADLVLIAPATANIIAKLAYGIADDVLTTQVLACTCKKLVAPAMNTAMLNNVATKRNIKTLEEDGFQIIESASGLLACGDVGEGKLPDDEILFAYVEKALYSKKDLIGKRVLITAGATQESLDPVRYLTNHSTGKMGYSIANECMLRGADVTLVTAPSNLKSLPFVKTINVKSAEDMLTAVSNHFQNQAIIIKSAAVADYTPLNYTNEKIKKRDGNLSIPLKRTTDILKFLGEHKTKEQFICGFSMETENMLENSRKKLIKKKVDMIVAINLRVESAGFGGDTVVVTFITENNVKELPKMSKSMVAAALIDEILSHINS